MKASSTKAVLESRHMFTIYKEGHTTGGPVQIVALKGQPFDIEKKVAFYIKTARNMKKIMAGEVLTKGLLDRLNDNAWGVTYGLLVVVSERKKWDLSMGVAALHDKSNRTIVSIPAIVS